LAGAGVSFGESAEILFYFSYLAYILTTATKAAEVSAGRSRVAFEVQ
jgi:hypothetical protein